MTWSRNWTWSWRKHTEPSLVLGHQRPGPRSWLPAPRLTLAGADLRQHMHVMGITGQGKSKLLASMFAQLHAQGQACAVIDPHRDLALDCLRLLAERGERVDGRGVRPVLFIDFARSDAYVPFNILRQPYDAHTIARNLVEACKRAWPALANGAAPTFENILLHAVVVLVANELPLIALPRLLTDKRYRDMSLERVTDAEIVHFFRDRYDTWGRQGTLMRESTLNRIALLTFSPALRYSLGQARNAIDFRHHMDAGVSVIYNLGGLDEATQSLLGCLLTVGYEVAALSRAQQPAGQRRPYRLILDEFSQFTATSETAFARILSQARKHGLFLTLAHQTWSQVSSRLGGALQNSLSIAFRLGRSDAEWAAPRFGRFHADTVKHAISDATQATRSHPLFQSLAESLEQWTAAFEDLPPQEAFIKQSGEAVRVRTLDVPYPRLSTTALAGILDHYGQQLLQPARHATAEVDRILQTATTDITRIPQRRVLLRSS